MKKFAVFDIDGTLIRWQLYHALTNRMAKDGLLGEGSYVKIREARKRWKDRLRTSSFREYETELVQSFSEALKNIKISDFNKVVTEIVAEYKSQTYVYTRDLIKQLKNDGYFLIAISGSQHELVEEIARHYGFDDWIGSDYEKAGGFFTGKTEVVAHDKGKYLSQMVKKHALDKDGSVAVGDTFSDIALLEAVDSPIAFNPEIELYDEAKKRGWRIVVERKNVIYKLEPGKDGYKLI